MANAMEKLANRIVGMDERLTALITTPRLAQSSIENGAIDAYGSDGTLTMSVGLQSDGSNAAVSYTGPAPPTPTAPILEAGTLSLTVKWDGFFLGENGLPDPLSVAPLDFSRVEVHVSLDPNFDPKLAVTIAGTIETPRGAPVVASPLQAVPYYVRLVARTLSGKASEASPIRSATPDSAIDQEALDAELADMNQQITLARTEVITDERFDPNSLTVWPFIGGAIPQGALAPGAIGSGDIADFSLVARKFKTNRHQIY